ncbi:DMT family transporter [Paucibacter sp. JuS9]|uniref:DMT family transporter n=1 Tax=Paucibacter sp. JuS9 TaxID=3228748 RepID=UPI003757EFCB
MSHRRALLLMILVTLLWSTAGVVTRHLEAARSFELTFWRSAFNAISLVVLLRWLRGPAFWGQLVRAPRLVWLSGAFWGLMFTAFMVALSMVSVATVLVTMALGPLFTALFSRVFLRHQLPVRTWVAIALATLGIAWMFWQEAGEAGGAGLSGILVALLVPLAGAGNWTLLQRATHGSADPDAPAPGQDMLPAVLIGALISAALTLPLAWPFQASAHDLGLLGFLGLCQLAIPCLLAVRLSRVLPAPEIALLGQLEVIFGVLWAWLGAGEAPAGATLIGGAIVLAALAGNEILALRQRRSQ